MPKKVIFLPVYDYDKIIYKPLENVDDVYFAGTEYIKNPVLKILNKLHTSYTTNKKFLIPFQKIWYPIYTHWIKINREEECIFVFVETSKLGYDFEYVNFLKKKYPKSHFVFRCENAARFISCQYLPRYNNHDCLKKIAELYDIVVTFDKSDAEKYGWKFCYSSYNGISDLKKSAQFESDLLFVGRDKGRLAKLVDIYDLLSAKGVNCKFFVLNPEKPVKRDGIVYIDDTIPYSQYLQYVANTKCLLEVLATGQRGNTLRLGEAIFYEKKLLTDADDIKNHVLYSPKFVQIISDHIDETFVFENTNFDFQENKKLISPTYFIHQIECMSVCSKRGNIDEGH